MKFTLNVSCLVTVCLILVTLTGCQSTISTHVNFASEELLVNDDIFVGTAYEIESSEQIFRLPDEIKQELHRLTAAQKSMPDRTRAVLKFILSYADRGLTYDNSDTLTAAQTLSNSKANCLSLSILAYSLAREVNMEAVFQDVLIPEYFSSELNQTWLNGHVNLRLKHSRLNDNKTILFGNDMIVDFDPYSIKRQFPAVQVTRDRIVAMFYNNKAAVSYANNNMAQTYAYYKAAIKVDPEFSVTWSNLGILYRTHGLLVEAEQAYQLSLALNPDSTNTLANLSYLYRVQGNHTKAESLESIVYNKRKSNPYYHIMLGVEALKNAQYGDASDHYKKAIKLDKLNHEAYFGLAKSYYFLNEPVQAAITMAKARKYAPSTADKARYEHKLAILNQFAQRM